jgi:hypothetical protein
MTDLQGMILSGLIAVIVCRLRSDRDTRAMIEPVYAVVRRVEWEAVAIAVSVLSIAVAVGFAGAVAVFGVAP